MSSASESDPTSSTVKRIKEEGGSPSIRLRCVGFCGVDESFTTEDKFPFPEYIEWGVLFRPEREGTMRFPKLEWVESFVKRKNRPLLAAHLCSTRCEEVLRGDFEFVQYLHKELGFKRFQINATKPNGVDSSVLGRTQVESMVNLAVKYPTAEIIIQRNEETAKLWQGLEDLPESDFPPNISFLFDASVGRGVVVENFEQPKFSSSLYGYAGGLKPENIETVVRKIVDNIPSGATIWIDMESGIRLPATDEFSAERAWKVCEIIERLRKERLVTFEIDNA